MADFNTHIFGAAAVVSFGATCCSKILSLSMSEGLMLTAAGMVGGVLPDIDLRQSQPSRALFSALGLVGALVWLFANMGSFTGLELWLGAVSVFLAVRFPLWWLFHTITVHRGALHSINAACMAGALTTAVAWQHFSTNELQSWLLGVFMAAGYLVHLSLDEIYSVDFTGIKIRRSFGSALKLFDADHLPASCLILFIFGFAWFWTPPVEVAVNQWLAEANQWRTALFPDWLPQLLGY